MSMFQTNKMICPDCGAEMNHHAMKVDYGADEPLPVDPLFGGVLKEVHTCHECGRSELRAVAEL
jgi:C4-type Zn-finger protein